MSDVKLSVLLADIHYPEHDKKAIRAAFEFIERNKKKISNVVIVGDGLDCANVSRHTKNKPRLRKRRGYKKDIQGFQKDILDPIDKMVPHATRTYICGNHEDWIQSDLLDESPELEGIVDVPIQLGLKQRGWKWVNCGEYIEIGKFVILHGDQIGSSIHVAKKLVDDLSSNSVMGHVHRASMYSKTSRVSAKRKWAGYTLPCLCTLAPAYAKGKPNAFMNGIGILETWGTGYGNLYLAVCIDGQFSYGGQMYGKKAA